MLWAIQRQAFSLLTCWWQRVPTARWYFLLHQRSTRDSVSQSYSFLKHNEHFDPPRQTQTQPAIPCKLQLIKIWQPLYHFIWSLEINNSKFFWLKYSLLSTKISPMLDLSEQSTYIWPWLLSSPPCMRHKKAALLLKKGGKVKPTPVWDLKDTSVQTLNQQEGDLHTKLNIHRKFPRKHSIVCMIRFLMQYFFLAFNQKHKQAPGNLSVWLAVYLVHLFWKASHGVKFCFSGRFQKSDMPYPNMCLSKTSSNECWLKLNASLEQIIAIETLASWLQVVFLTHPPLAPHSHTGHPRTSCFSAWKGNSALLDYQTRGVGSKGSPCRSLNRSIQSHCWWSPRSLAGVPAGPPGRWHTLTAWWQPWRWDPQEVSH